MNLTKEFQPLPPGEGFCFNYQPSRLDRNALFALNRVFDPEKISLVRSKYHRAKLNLEDLRKDLMEYSSIKGKRHHSDAYYAIFESVDKDIFGNTKIIPLTHGAVAAHPNLPRMKSCGLPLKNQGYATKGEALDNPNIVRAIRADWYAIERRENIVLPDVACYARAQICTRDKNKVRATWGYPLTVYLTEGQYFYPLLEQLKNKASPTIAYGIEMGTGGMQYINEMARGHQNKNFLIGDWSKFDKKVPAWLIRDAFKMIARHIDFTQVQCVEGKYWPVRESASKRRFERLVRYFIDTPIQMSSGERFMKHGGIPSGSCWTNLVDGIINAIVTRYCLYNINGELPLDDVYLGDDIVAITEKPIDIDLFAKFANDEFSMELNCEKSYQTANPENIHFLGYFNMSGTPYKPLDTVIASSVYPERPVETKFETAIRLVGQAYSCFEPTDAKKFFIAAHILRQETDARIEDMEMYIKEHTHFFKYLQTLGISARQGLKIPKCTELDLVFLTAPGSPRRKWVRKFHNMEELSALAYEKWNKEENIRF